MFDVVLYYSKGGKSLEVAKSFGLPIENVSNNPDLEKYSGVLIVCPTYGDEEVPLEMEDYLINLKTKNKKYAICELGNLFGHESEFGPLKIIEHELNKRNWQKINSISLDSVPDVDWESLKIWTKKLLKK